MNNNQSLDNITGKYNMSFEYEGIFNVDNENIVNNKNIIYDENDNKNIVNKNDNYNEDDGYMEDDESNTAEPSSIISYFTPYNVSTKKNLNSNVVQKKINKLVTVHLHTEHKIFKTQKCETQLPLPLTTTPTPTSQQTIETVIQKHIKNTLPLLEKQQNHITYQLIV
ncbi:15927_t:CDS:2 [Cetraspora pellucida]|uniref:15927_t:CDS:1 n=1 Tax=Cetraspora pellucida TaxID=1433469 RepID=A0A9N9ISX4_9GLOM|nr:15927_t:CDS:2 [Cetraspora pellucida]